MKIDTEPFRVHSGEKVSLKKQPTLVEPFYRSKEQYQQCRHHAANSHLAPFLPVVQVLIPSPLPMMMIPKYLVE